MAGTTAHVVDDHGDRGKIPSRRVTGVTGVTGVTVQQQQQQRQLVRAIKNAREMALLPPRLTAPLTGPEPAETDDATVRFKQARWRSAR